MAVAELYIINIMIHIIKNDLLVRRVRKSRMNTSHFFISTILSRSKSRVKIYQQVLHDIVSVVLVHQNKKVLKIFFFETCLIK